MHLTARQAFTRRAMPAPDATDGKNIDKLLDALQNVERLTVAQRFMLCRNIRHAR